MTDKTITPTCRVCERDLRFAPLKHQVCPYCCFEPLDTPETLIAKQRAIIDKMQEVLEERRFCDALFFKESKTLLEKIQTAVDDIINRKD
jgi:hypothetical protein